MRKYCKLIPLKEEMVDYIQAAFEDYKAKQDLITMIFELHKYDEDYSIIDSAPFRYYESCFMKAKVKYDTIMSELQNEYIPDEYKTAKYRFEVDFDNKQIGIY